MFTLDITKRENIGKASKRRENGNMPAVFYGRKEESTPISLSQKVFEKVWKTAGESSVILLKGVGDEKEALIHTVDFHPVSGEPRHVDFYIIEKGKKVTVSVPLEFIGEAPAVKELSGILVKVMHELEIEVLPKELPQQIEIDISKLKDFDSRILVSDIALPESATPTASLDEVTALVTEASVVEEEAPTEAPDFSDIEVEKKGKKEEEDTDTPEAKA